MSDSNEMADNEITLDQRVVATYTAPAKFEWPSIRASEAGLDESRLKDAAEYASANGSDSLLVLRNGQCVFEQYWNGKTADDLQQTYSGTKSLFSLLVGRCIEAGYIQGLDQSVRDFVPEIPEEQVQITFGNALAMMSGMEHSFRIESNITTGISQMENALHRVIVAPPMTQYHYNNSAYRLLFFALERASGKNLDDLTKEQIFEPLAFNGACWVHLFIQQNGGERFGGYQSIRMTPTDFAKSAQIILDNGQWQGETFVSADYAKALVTAANPDANPSFGLFHHLNAGDHFRGYIKPVVIDRKLIPGAPDDLFLMYGNGGQITVGVPSLGLVIVRTGVEAVSLYEPNSVVEGVVRRACDAVC